MARTPVSGYIPIRERLQPQGDIVSTYVRPADPAPSNLHQLAGALDNFSRSIGGMLEKRKKEGEDNDAIRGKKAALLANGEAYGEGVRNGSIMAMDSPAFMAAYKQTQGEIIGKRLASKASSAYLEWDGRNDTDPENFNQFMGTFMQENLAEINDPDILKGVIPYLENTSTAMINTNTDERNKATYNGAVDTYIASSAMDLDAQFDLGIAAGGDINYDQMWADMMETRETALGTGVLAGDYDKLMYEMVVAKAIENRDPAILALLDRPTPGMEVPYSQTPEGRVLKQQTIDNFETLWAADTRAKEAAEKDFNEKQKDKYTVDAIRQLAADPTKQFDESFIQTAEQYDPTFRLKLNEWRGKMGEDEDPALIVGIQQKIMSGQYGYQDLMQDMAAGGPVSNPATAGSLSQMIDRVSDNSNDKLTDNDTYKRVMTLIQNNLTDDNLFAAGGVTEDAIRAQYDFQASMLDWYEANPNATTDEIGRQALGTWERIQKSITAGVMGGGSYAADPSAPSAAVPGADASMVPTPEAGAAAEPAADPMAAWQGEQPPKYDALNEDQQREIEKRAAVLGVPPDLYIQSLWQDLRAQANGQTVPEVGGGNDQPAIPAGQVEAGNIDLNDRQVLNNADGSISTEQSISFEEDGVEVLIPTVIDGKKVSDEDAIAHYQQTGEHLGKFDSPEAADAYAEKLHQQQGQKYDQSALDDGFQPGELGYKNNNPGNMKWTPFTEQMGATGMDEGGFAIFPDGVTGLAAMEALLFDNPAYTDLSLNDAIAQYAPAEDSNDPAGYVNYLVEQTGLDPTIPLKDYTPDQRQKLINAMTSMEGTATTPGDLSLNSHTIKQGDTLGAISKQYGVSVADLQKANGLGNSTTIKAGAKLAIPDTRVASLGPTGATPGAIADDVFNLPSFAQQWKSVKGQANFFTSGRNKPPAGNPGTAAWQAKNTQLIPVTLSNGKVQQVRVYGPAKEAFEGFIADLQASGYTIDNIGGQVVRNKRGSKSLSEHSYGTAIDINGEGPDHDHDKMADSPARNGFSQKLVTDLPPNISQLAAKWGLSWGGDWKGKKDAMHFEYTGVKPLKATVRTASL